jgi:hypothetical protein
MGMPPTGQRADLAPVVAHERFFFRACPSLHLPFCCYRIGYRFEVLREYEIDRAALRSLATEQTCIMLCNADFEVIACRADVIAAIGTPQHVEIRTTGHGPPASFETRGFAALLRMRAEREPSQLKESRQRMKE